MLHVELIQNEWAAGQQKVVARIVINGAGVVQIETGDEASWAEIALKPFLDPDLGRELSPEADPETFVRSLHKHLAGDYLFATEAHEEGECDFPVGERLPLKVVSEDAAQSHLARS